LIEECNQLLPDESFQSITCTGIDNLTRTTKRQNIHCACSARRAPHILLNLPLRQIQQDVWGSARTAHVSQQCLYENCLQMIEKEQWPYHS